MSAHAKLSASGSHRWINCPGSIVLSETIPDRGSSSFAMEGTAAHALGEHCLEEGSEADKYFDCTIIIDSTGFAGPPLKMAAAKKILEGSKPALATFKVDDDMIEAVQVYLDHVRKEHAGAGEGSEMHLEQRFDLSWLRPDMFGTGDATIVPGIGSGALQLIDYKHGKGVVVEPEENSQLMYYALGALHDFGDLTPINRVVMTIVQPRAPHAEGGVRSWSCSADELEAWGRDILGPAADATREKNAKFCAGGHCKFCPAAHVCEELRDESFKAAGADFDDLPDEGGFDVPKEAGKVSDAMAAVAMIDAWVKAVNGQCQALLEAGTPVSGYKLVKKRPTRKWIDEAEAEKKLKGKRVKAAEMYQPKKLKTPPQMEKVKSIGKDVVAELCHKVSSGLTVAEESDRRPAEEPSAMSDFDDDLKA